MAGKRTRVKFIAAEIESTYGSAATIGATDVIVPIECTITPLQADVVERELVKDFYSANQQLLANLSDQLELSKIDAKDSTSSIFLLDKPTVSYSKAGITPLRAVTLIFIIMFIASLSLECYRNRRQLFVFNHR